MKLSAFWLLFCALCVLGLAWVDWVGYAPGTCTDQRQQIAGQDTLTPCTYDQSDHSIRRSHTYEGK